jgi:hypothetical protein
MIIQGYIFTHIIYCVVWFYIRTIQTHYMT